MTALTIIATLGYLSLIGYVIKTIQWPLLFAHKQRQHLVFGAAASVFILWIFRAGIYDGLDVHFLWLAALTLTFGFRYALLISFIALTGVTIVGKETWVMFGANGLLGSALPIALTYAIYSFTFHRVPRHLFVYVFVCAFFPGALAIALKMVALGGFYALNGTHEWIVVMENYLVLIPLMVFPEAMFNGMTMTLLVIYKPHWVKTFSDEHYFDPKD